LIKSSCKVIYRKYNFTQREILTHVTRAA